MVQTLSHRGPDGIGISIVSDDCVAFGHTRLSIIDLSDNASQPMSDVNGRYHLVFNGEIYNYKELKQQLVEKGFSFVTASDTEVLLISYIYWGKSCVHHLRGIFAFAIHDSIEKTCFIARDHAGVKPLYYYQDGPLFIFASETKAILANKDVKRELDVQGLQLYLRYGNLPAEYSIFKKIRKLLPGHSLMFKQDGEFFIEQYWKLNYSPVITDEKEAEVLLGQKIDDAIRIQTVSDVPIATLLSGGVDSTIVSSVIQGNIAYPLHSFSIGFDDKRSDESAFAGQVSDFLNTIHHNEIINESTARNLLSEIATICDEPFHLNGVFPYLALSKLVNSQKFKVAFGGDGADELFSGYLWYERFANWNRQENRNSIRNLFYKMTGSQSRILNAVDQFSSYNGYLNYEQIQNLTGSVDKDLLRSIIGRHYRDDLAPELAAQLIDFNCFMPDHCLTKVDRLSMSQGVEVRVPFLDIELIELTFSIDHGILFKNGERKAILKRAMANHLPPGIDFDRKKGFSSPLHKWFAESLAESGWKELKEGALVTNGILDRKILGEMYPTIGAGNQLLLYGLELWCANWLKNLN